MIKEKYITRFISAVFNPLLMPTYSLLIIFNLNVYFSLLLPAAVRWRLISLVFILTFLFPLFILLIMLKRKIIKSMEMKTREERVFPLLITAVFFYINYYLFKNIQVSPIFNYFILGATFGVIFTLIVNFWWKISVHMIAIGGLFGTLLGISFVFLVEINYLILLVIFISGLVGYARLKAKAHNQLQVYSGFLAGTFIMLLIFIIL